MLLGRFSVSMSLGLLALCLLISACGFKSTSFVGVHGMGTQKIFGVVAQSAVEPIDQFLRGWLAQWENGSCDTCYNDLNVALKGEVSREKLNEIAGELKNRFGPPQQVTSLDQPVTALLPRMDEALMERSMEAALKYYSYVVTTYLSHRPIKNLVYVLAVGMRNGQLSILTFGINEQVQNPKDRSPKVYWFGIPF